MIQEIESQQLLEPRKHILSQLHHMYLLWKKKLFADVTFVVENEEILAHRNILVKCHYFLNMFTSNITYSRSLPSNDPRWHDRVQF